jgi:RNA polymerase sigma-70 factor, ECF subfamily
MNMYTDETSLIQQLHAGSKQAFETVFRTYYKMLCSFAVYYTKNSELAEEIVQDLFCKLWEKRSELKINTSLKSYLYKSTYNHLLNHIRQEEVSKKYVKSQMEISGSGFESTDKIIEKQLAVQIQKAIDSLPEKRREIFILSRNNGLKYQEIANVLDIKLKTVESQMVKALEHLRQNLKEYL